MARIVMLQFCVAFVIAAIAWLIFGKAAGISSLLGGLCYSLPNTLFALRLHLATKKPGGASSASLAATFFVGEFLKIVITVALLAAVVWLYHDLNWPAFLVGFVVVLKSYFILLFRKSK